MAMSESKSEIIRKFRDIIRPQIRGSMADTLDNFLLAAPGQHGVSESAVDYVINKLWNNHNDPRGEK